MLVSQPSTDPFMKLDTSFMSCRCKVNLGVLWVTSYRSKLMHSDTHNPEGVVFDLCVEALVFIHPPLDAVFTGVVWKYGLAWPHLPGRQISHEGALRQAPGDAGPAHPCNADGHS